VYGVPANLDLSMFVRCTLDQLQIGLHEIQFVFSGMPGAEIPRLTVESRWECRNASGLLVDASLGDHQLPSERDAYRVHVLLGQRVVSFTIAPPDSLTLSFDTGATLTAWDDSSHYESFHIEPGGLHF
jgi:hypothetical protein